MFDIPNFPDELGRRRNAALLTGILRGVERECLRVDREGELSKRPHPPALGSALMHPQITTDFSEALLEFITPPCHRTEDLLDHLLNIHRFVAPRLGDELLWPNSMPCRLQEDDKIPVALYGSSNIAQLKTTYRRGLGHRYGRKMQTVAGLHYNFSLPNAFWAHFQQKDNSLLNLDTYKNERYFALVRNFRRHYWLLVYLFGASPALCESFVGERPHTLEKLRPCGALYGPFATSLRMGDLGYQSKAQEALYVCYNELPSYVATLGKAMRQSYPAYEAVGLQDSQGIYQQLSTHLLQIENEFYSAIRPKRSAHAGETALTALSARGVEYIEVRCLDLNPFSPIGFEAEQAHLLDTFLLYCALAPSAESNRREFDLILRNQKRVVMEGRRPGLMLEHGEHGELPLQQWGSELIKAMAPVAAVLDAAHESSDFSRSLQTMLTRLEDPSSTPSAQLLGSLREQRSFSAYTLDMAKKHMASLNAQPLSDYCNGRMEAMAEESLQQQADLEAQPQQPFGEYLTDYYRQYDALALESANGDCSA